MKLNIPNNIGIGINNNMMMNNMGMQMNNNMMMNNVEMMGMPMNNNMGMFMNNNLMNNMKNMEVQNPKEKAFNVLFSTRYGKTINIIVKHGTSINDLIKKFFAEIKKPELIKRKEDICFLYNASKINIDSKEKVENFFRSKRKVS